tara:strand:+ start:688 stop:1050 length:363 start_codon:yes stop_codon:yes gene_type:complete
MGRLKLRGYLDRFLASHSAHAVAQDSSRAEYSECFIEQRRLDQYQSTNRFFGNLPASVTSSTQRTKSSAWRIDQDRVYGSTTKRSARPVTYDDSNSWSEAVNVYLKALRPRCIYFIRKKR